MLDPMYLWDQRAIGEWYGRGKRRWRVSFLMMIYYGGDWKK